MPIQATPVLQSHVMDMPANPPEVAHQALAIQLPCNQDAQRTANDRLTAYQYSLASTLDGPTLRYTAISLAILLGAGALMGVGIAGLANAGPLHIRRVCGGAPETSVAAVNVSNATADCHVHQRIKDACVGTLFGATILAIVGTIALGNVIVDIKYRMRHGDYRSEPGNSDFSSGVGGGGGVGDGGGGA